MEGVRLLASGGVEVRVLRDPRELEEAVEVHASAWGSRDYREVAPAHLLRGLADNGGLVLGAFVDGRMVGASYGWFVHPSGGEPYFYSHATGVAEGYKYRGVGFALKLRQREEVLKRGFRLVKWTWDPLQSLNSRFNLAKLGAVFREYHVNYYGEMTDEVNRGLGSDRVKAEWWLDSRLVELRIAGRLPSPTMEELMSIDAWVALPHPEGSPAPAEPGELEPLGGVALVAIPGSIGEVRERHGLEAAKAWRRATRSALKRLVEDGYIGVDYARDSRGRPYLVLVKAPLSRVLEAKLPWLQV